MSRHFTNQQLQLQIFIIIWSVSTRLTILNSFSSLHLSAIAASETSSQSESFTKDHIITTSPSSVANKGNATTSTVATTTKATTPNPNINKTICYRYVGCFDNFPPFDNANLFLPQSPETCGTQFFLFTRQNPNTSVALDYKDPTPLQRSQFDPKKPTKFIIHGFNNNNKTKWLYELKDDFLFNVRHYYILLFLLHSKKLGLLSGS